MTFIIIIVDDDDVCIHDHTAVFLSIKLYEKINAII